MTAFERFDPFEQRITAALDDIAAPRRPGYLDDILQQTARTTQRPRWSFPGRWLPMDNVYPRTVRIGGRSLAPILIVLLVALLAAFTVIGVVGALNRTPPPFGPARNGDILFAQNGKIYTAQGLGATPKLLVDGVLAAAGPSWSPDGRRFLFGGTANDEALYVADADGTHVRVVFEHGHGLSVAWAPDSQTIAVRNQQRDSSWLFLAHADGSPATPVNLGNGAFALDDIAFRPPAGRQLLVRAEMPTGRISLLLVDLTTDAVKDLGLPSNLVFGKDWDLRGATWSPDGTRIAYTQIEAVPDGNPSGHFRLHIVNADGTGDTAVPGPADAGVQDAWPIFSPDGNWIVVHRWTWKSSAKPEGWLAVLPADGSAPARDIGPRIGGGEDTGLIKAWSPDGTRILMRTGNTQVVYSIDPVTGAYEQVPWTTTELPDWQRRP